MRGSSVSSCWARSSTVMRRSSPRASSSSLPTGSTVVATSQSGETTDTLRAVAIAQERGARVIGLVNTEGTSLTRVADTVIPLRSGP